MRWRVVGARGRAGRTTRPSRRGRVTPPLPQSGATADARPRGGARVQLALTARRAQVPGRARAAIFAFWVVGRKMVILQPLGRFRARKVLQWGKEDAGTHRSHSRGTAWFFGCAIELGHRRVGFESGRASGFFRSRPVHSMMHASPMATGSARHEAGRTRRFPDIFTRTRCRKATRKLTKT